MEQVRTSRVATPRPIPFIRVVVTASSGQRPSSCTSPGLSVQIPCLKCPKPRVVLLIVSCREDLVTVSVEISQRVADTEDYSTRRNRCAGQLIEFTTVAPGRPGWQRRIFQRAPGELVYPVRFIRIDQVSKSRCLAVAERANAGDYAIPIDSNQETNGPRVPTAGIDDQHGCNRRIVSINPVNCYGIVAR